MRYKLILDWCKSQYGKSQFQSDYPLLKIKKLSDYKGIYDADSNIIFIDKTQIKSEEDAIKSIIHEYIHYTQSKSLFEFLYNKGYEYGNHPFETQAENIAKKDWINCKNDLNLETE